jgi:putative endonuclease
MTGKTARRNAERKGRWSEAVAVLVLWLQGYHLLQHRYKCHVGEIDLIVKSRKILCFVEVKYRRGGASGYDVSPFQADRLVRAANLYLSQHPQYTDLETRFDLMLMGGWRWPRHIKGAFLSDHEGSKSII